MKLQSADYISNVSDMKKLDTQQTVHKSKHNITQSCTKAYKTLTTTSISSSQKFLAASSERSKSLTAPLPRTPKTPPTFPSTKSSSAKPDKKDTSVLFETNRPSYLVEVRATKDVKPTPSKHPIKKQITPIQKLPRNISTSQKTKLPPKLQTSPSQKSLSKTSPSILTTPTHACSKGSRKSKEVQFKGSCQASHTRSKKRHSPCLLKGHLSCSSPLSVEHPLSLEHSFYASCEKVPTKLPSPIHSAATIFNSGESFSMHDPCVSCTNPLTRPPNSPSSRSASKTSSTSSSQQKVSWDKSLQQLSKGLKNICGSPEAFASKSFKRASSLSATYRRQNTVSHLSLQLNQSAHKSPSHQSKLLRNLSQSSLSPNRLSSHCPSTPPQQRTPQRMLSHSPTFLVACKEKEIIGFIPVSEVLSSSFTTEQVFEASNIMHLSSASDQASALSQTDASSQQAHHQTVLKPPLYWSSSQSKKTSMKKQQSMIMKDEADMLSFRSIGIARKLTVRHEETFQSLETELQRVLFSGEDTKIDKKPATSSHQLLKNAARKKNASIGEDELYPDVWEKEKKEDDDGMDFMQEDYVPFQKIALPKSNVCVEDLYVQMLNDGAIVVGALNPLSENAQSNNKKCNKGTKNDFENIIIEKIEFPVKSASDLICTISKNLKWLLLKEKKKRGVQTSPESSNHSSPALTNSFQQFNNDKHFVTFSDLASALYLPIFTQYTKMQNTFLSIFLKLPQELQSDTLSVKRIDDAVLVSANMAKMHTPQWKEPSLSGKKNGFKSNKVDNDEVTNNEETFMKTDVMCAPCNLNHNQHESTVKTSPRNQTDRQSEQTIEADSALDSGSPIAISQTSNIKKGKGFTTPIHFCNTSSPFHSLSNSPSTFNFHSPPANMNSFSPDFFASFTLPCDAIPRSTTAYLSHHQVLSITIPLHTNPQRRFSF